MTTQEYLDQFTRGLTGCTAAGLVDISSGIVLCAAADQKHPQEYYDNLCALAARVFDETSHLALTQAQGDPNTELRRESVVSANGHICLFIQSPSDPAEAMFCVCTNGIDVTETLAAARSSLHYIEQEQE